MPKRICSLSSVPFFFSSRRRHTRWPRDWSSDVCSSDLGEVHRLSSMYFTREFVNAGGLMSYGADQSDIYRRAAYYVGKILKAAKPADLPVEQPKKFELIINLKTAKQIGVMIPPEVLARASRLIK